MKIEFAFSLDCKREVDIEQAYDLYWAEKIKDKRNFQCSETCIAQITGTNLDKPRRNMKQAPHFRLIGEHSDDCNLIKESIIKTNHSEPSNRISSPRARISENLPDIFEEERPEDHTIIKKINNKSSQVQELEQIERRKNTHTYHERFRSLKYYGVRPLVQKYYTYREENSLENNYVTIKEYKISYKELFVQINSQDFSQLSNYKRIYYGLAYVNLKNSDNREYYTINFQNNLKFQETSIRPSIYINQEMIEKAFCRKLIEETFAKISNKPSLVYCFIYCKPYLKQNGQRDYINMYIDNMDHLDIKEEF